MTIGLLDRAKNFSVFKLSLAALLAGSGLYHCAVAAPDSRQLEALSEFYQATNGVDWSNNSGWLVGDPCKDWFGVVCNSEQTQIASIDLSDNGLLGNLPESVAAFSTLTHLQLRGNELSGQLPGALGELSQLQVLDLGINQFSGDIPLNIGQLQSLQILNLDFNSFDGVELPAELGQLSNLQFLNLNDNNFAGELPDSLGQLSKLERLVLDDNNLSGSIPESLGQLTALSDLRLYGNRFSGNVPQSLSALVNMEKLLLQRNALSGALPSQLMQMQNLLVMDISWNALYSEDASLNTFIDQRGNGNYLASQTLSPDPQAADIGETAIRLHWTPTNTEPATPGGYSIYQSSSAEGPFTHVKDVANKNIDSSAISGLNAASDYYFKITSYTNANTNNGQPVESNLLETTVQVIRTLNSGNGNDAVDTSADNLDDDADSGSDTGATEDETTLPSEDDSSSSGGGGGAVFWLLLMMPLGILFRRRS